MLFRRPPSGLDLELYMRKITAVALLVTFICSAVVPSFAQRSKNVLPGDIDKTPLQKPSRPTRPFPVVKGDFAQFEKVEAYSDGSGVVVQWQMVEETGNVGFDVYRVNTKEQKPVNDSLISGSLAEIGKQTLYGKKYEFYDPEAGLDSVYVIQAMGQDGRRISSETVSVQYSYDIEASTGRSRELLAKTSNTSNGNIEKTSPSLGGRGTLNFKNVTAAADLAAHRWVVSKPGAKIAVRTEGMYRVRLTELQAATNLFTSGNVANWRLFKEGVEQAINIGSDANGLYFEFYGKGLDIPESDTRIYYLIVDTVPGKRMVSRIVRGRPINGPAINYAAVTEKRERNTYVGSILNGDAENWWGRLVTSTSTAISVNLTGVDFSVTNCVFTLKMQSYSLQVPPTVGIAINGHSIGNISGQNDQQPFSGQFSIPTNYLVEGANSVQLTSQNGSGDYSLFDSIKINYSRLFKADQNRIAFPVPVNQQAIVSGFTTSNIRLFDMTVEGSPSFISNPVVTQNGATYSVQSAALRTRLAPTAIPTYAVENSSLLQAAAVTVNNPSNYSSTLRNVDLIIITHSASDFIAAANTWADYRRSAAGGGFNVEVVDVADVMDEFGYGTFTAAAINDFLRYANTNWVPQVAGHQYVLLLGDASRDPRNYLGYGLNNLVPSKIVTTIYNETASDDALADFNDDGLTEMSIGRVPTRTAVNITTVFNKSVSFETPSNQSLGRGSLFAYDEPNGYDFGSMSQDLSNQLPPSMPKTFVSRAYVQGDPQYDASNPRVLNPDAQANLLSSLNTSPGKYIANYSGHGAQSFWGSSSFMSNSTVSSLNNTSSPTIFTMLTCLNGYFIGPAANDDAIADVLIKSPNGGAVVAWASTGLTTADVQMLMGRQFFNQIGIGNIKRMGDLIRDAKAQIPYGTDVRYSWVLFGDPMLKVRQ